MRHLKYGLRPIAAAAALSMVLVACGTGGDETAEDTAPTETTAEEDTGEETEEDTETEGGGELAIEPATSGDPFADSKAAADHIGNMSAPTLAAGIAAAADIDGDVEAESAQLRQGLTKILQEHVYLSGFAIDTALAFGPDSEEAALGIETLDTNTVELADAVASVAGDDQREPFIELWRNHIGFFVDYAVASAEGEDQAAEQAQEDLSGYTQDAGAFFEESSGGELPQDAIAESLQTHIDTLSAAIDASVEGSPSVAQELKGASDHIRESSATLAAGLATATEMGGSSDTAAADLSANLTGTLQEHVYLAGLAVKQAYANGPDSDAFTAAAETLDTNSVELSEAVASFTDEDTGEQFLELWRNHIGFFVDYAVATAEGDEDGRVQAIEDLDGYREDAGAFFEENTNGELPADDVAASLEEHIATLAGAIDSFAAVDFESAGGGEDE